MQRLTERRNARQNKMLELNIYYNKYLAKCNCVINAINRYLAKEAREPKIQEE